MVLSVINLIVLQFFGDSKSLRASKSHHWFKNYGNFDECVDFAYWWSFSGGGCAINGAIPSSLKKNPMLHRPGTGQAQTLPVATPPIGPLSAKSP